LHAELQHTWIDPVRAQAIIRARVTTQVAPIQSITSSAAPTVIAPGNYDGVHLGHRALIRSARSFAQAHGLLTSVLTFDPHPGTFLGAAEKPVITNQARRAELLQAAGADRVFVQHFTHEYAALSPEAFIDTLLVRGARALVVGPDFRFGNMRAGDVDMLKELAAARGFTVLIEPPVMLDGERVSSSAVREALGAGDVLRATQLLGRVHEIEGNVVLGHQRGRTIGFPTANIALDTVMPPADGVYAVVVRELDRPERVLLRGVANLGNRPTFNAGRSVEAHIFDFDGDLYDKPLRIGFTHRIRGEQRFAGVEELRRQINLDCERARELLRGALPEWTEQL
jgi:riboflavin kinase / FMN adenylyltransferase